MAGPDARHPSDSTLRSYSVGALDDRSAKQVDRHLDACAACRQRVPELSDDSFLSRVYQAGQAAARLAATEPWLGNVPGTDSTVPDGSAATLPPGLADHPDYQILRELGRGGMGVVYLAHNRLMGRDEVLKIISQDLLGRPGVLDRFLREIRAAAQLHHPNIVTAYTAFRCGEVIAFCMEFVEGLDLAKLVKTKGPLPVANACSYAHQAALGLQHAHELGMVHRDIKPGNLMLTRWGHRATIKILDFGLAKASREKSIDGSLTHEGQILGSPDFIAPEQIRDAQAADCRADIYSLGCTLYYLLTGKPPFPSANLYDVLQAHHSADAKPLNLVRADVPVELAALVAKMMAKEPERRFQTPSEAARALMLFFKMGRADTPSPDAERPDVRATAAALQPTVADPAPIPPAPPTRAPRQAAPTDTQEVVWERLVALEPQEPLTSSSLFMAQTSWRQSSWRRPAIVAASVLGLAAITVLGYLAADRGRSKTVAQAPNATAPNKVAAARISTPESPPPSPAKPTPGNTALTRKPVETLIDSLAKVGKVVKSALLAPGPLSAKPSTSAPPVGLQSLFNGKDLTGWKTHPSQPGNWRVDNGILAGSGQPGDLYSERGDFQDFRLRVEARVNEGGNSGIHFRVPYGGSWNEDFHVELGGPATGVFYVRGRGDGIPQLAKTPAQSGGWFVLEVTAKKNYVMTKVNGTILAEGIDPHPQFARGHIAFELPNEQTVVEFRRIEIEEFPSATAVASASPTPPPVPAIEPPPGAKAPTVRKPTERKEAVKRVLADGPLKELNRHSVQDWSGGFPFPRFSPDSERMLLPRAWDLILVELKTGTMLTPPMRPGRPLIGNGNALHSADFTRDGKIVASYESQFVRVWDPIRGAPVRDFETPPLGGRFLDLRYSRPGKWVIGRTSIGSEIRIWDVESGKRLRLFQPPDPIRSLDLHPDGRTVATLNSKNLISFSDALTGDLLGSFPDGTRKVARLKYTPDGSHLLCLPQGSPEFWLVQTGDGTVQEFAGPLTNLIDAAVFPRSVFVAAIYADNHLRIWNAAAAAVVYEKPFPTELRRIGISPDGRYAVVMSSEEAIVYQVEMANPAPAKRKR
jgi:serine/threonine protein kinase